MKTPPTIYSLADELGLHPSMVSRAFTRPELVRQDKRERILQLAAERGYQPNLAARGLITGRTGMIGLLIPDIVNPFFPPLVRAVEAAAGAHDVQVLLIDSKCEAEAEAGLVGRVRTVVDGYILASPRGSTEVVVRAAVGVPCVLVNRQSPGLSSVIIDNTRALHAAADHLVDQGHRRFLLLRGPATSWAAEQRRRAVLDWVAQRPSLAFGEIGPYEALYEGGAAAADEILATGTTAVIAFDDVMACGVIAGLSERGVSVPGDVSVVGCDDVVLASLITPALTTIRAPFDEVAAYAVEALVRGVAGPTDPREVVLRGELVLRSSTT